MSCPVLAIASPSRYRARDVAYCKAYIIVTKDREGKERENYLVGEMQALYSPLGGEVSHISPTLSEAVPCAAVQCEVSEASECGAPFTELVVVKCLRTRALSCDCRVKCPVKGL